MINRKSYTGSRLALKSTTLNNLECQNREFYGFFVDFGLQDIFQERIALKLIEINKDRLHMKFLALNVDFNHLSVNCLGSRKPAHEGTKEWYPRKSHYFTVVGQSFVKTDADHHGRAANHNKH